MSVAIRRAQRLAALPAEVDLLVVGGGITGAGIALEAARRGVRVLLAEARDFAWGTSSRSSKLVHGGLRYLKQGRPGLTLESVRERQQLLRDAPGLVEPIPFLLADYPGRKPGRLMLQLGLAIYDRFAGSRSRAWVGAAEALRLAPAIDAARLRGASLYQDATTDDARLVLRVLQEAQASGATVLNHLRVVDWQRDTKGWVEGARLAPAEGGERSVRARCVIAATGVWADELRARLGGRARLRPLRGSHLLLPGWRLPLAQAVAFFHPVDGRPVFAYPWEGNTLVGTTDLDHEGLAEEPAISKAEVDYLVAALRYQFPGLELSAGDVISTWAGVRPVVDGGRHGAPSEEARDHIVLEDHGLISVTGGKLTTFRRIAQDTLARAAPRLPSLRASTGEAILPARPLGAAELSRLPAALRPRFARRLGGRYGEQLPALLAQARPEELVPVASSDTLWAELRWALRHEQVFHLDDLLLRRTRLGLVLRAGGAELLPDIEVMATEELGWDGARWAFEVERYGALIESCYRAPRP